MPNKVDVAYDVICTIFQLEVPDGEYAVRRPLTDEESELKTSAITAINEFLKTPTPKSKPRQRKKPKPDDDKKKVKA